MQTQSLPFLICMYLAIILHFVKHPLWLHLIHSAMFLYYAIKIITIIYYYGRLFHYYACI